MTSHDLGRGVLKDVSRSFYLSIRVLPSAVRDQIGLAYLLARASDTIADSLTAPAADRLRHLRAFDQMVQDGTTIDLSAVQNAIRAEKPGEVILIERLGNCLSWLRSMPPQDLVEIRAVIKTIIRGQSLDLQRFPTGPAVTSELRALQTTDELEEYTYLVAGCVGEFWTRICALHLPDYAKIPLPELLELGIAFGKGLQLVNILRDLPEDLRDGRCYLPEGQLTDLRIAPHSLQDKPNAAATVVNQWIERAEDLLEGGRQYIRAIRPARVRLACFLPWYLGCATLALLKQTPPLESAKRVKVPRSTVRTALWKGLIASWSDGPIRSRP